MGGWLTISIFISPLLGFALLMMLKDLAAEEFMESVTQDMELTHVKCSHCAEYVLPEATVCKYCGSALTPQPTLVEQRVAEKLAEAQEVIAGRRNNFLISVAIAAFITIGAWLATYLK
jgi:ribosomal protein L32